MERLKTGINIRGDYFYCPLAFQLNTYWNCEARCRHCYLRRLNRTWGQELKPLDVDHFEKDLDRILRGKGQSMLALGIKARKTLYVGSKADAYQDAELKHGVTREALRIVLERGFSVVIATMYSANLKRDEDLFLRYPKQVTIMPIISPGFERDWEVLERRKTTHPGDRLLDATMWKKKGINVGINGEPFIPGFHTEADFKFMCETLRLAGLDSYNTYNLHMNDWNAKEMVAAGIDIEKVWHGNQDKSWAVTLEKLIGIAARENIRLGMPDFVNSGWGHKEQRNTCCGMDVPNPCTFTVINWKRMIQDGVPRDQVLKKSWDGIGDWKAGLDLFHGKTAGLFGLGDIKGEL